MLWSGTTRTQDSRGIRPNGVRRIYQAQGEPRGTSMARVSSYKGTWCQYSLWTDQVKEGAWTVLVTWNQKIAIKQKGLWPAPQDRPGCKASQMWTARTSRPPHKCLTWITPLDYAQEETMPLVEWALTPMGHRDPTEEYANVIASTSHLEILCFVTGPPLARLPKQQKAVLTFCMRQNARYRFSGPWRGRAGIPGCPPVEKKQKTLWSGF